MNKLRPLLFATILFSLFSCEKEYSSENIDNTGSDLIVGLNCRISKIVSIDTVGGGNGKGLGSIEAAINSQDFVTRITEFDSLSNTIEFITAPVYSNDTVYIDADQYFVTDANRRIAKLHGLYDPTDPFSFQFDVFYVYNATGYLVTKNYYFTLSPTTPFYKVDYTYTGANLTHMTASFLPSGDLDKDADITYFTQLIPKRFIYIFPDEISYAQFNQFFDFGAKNFNAVKNMTVRTYDPGNVVRDSVVSTFSNYVMSRDNYVLSVQMGKDDQQCLPALAGKLIFSYHCR